MKYSQEFEELWSKYPRKAGKQYAFKHYKKILKNTDVSYNELINAVENYARECEKEERERKYIKKGVNFLRHGTYEDYILADINNDDDKIRKDIHDVYDYVLDLRQNFGEKQKIIIKEINEYLENNKLTYEAFRFIEKHLSKMQEEEK